MRVAHAVHLARRFAGALRPGGPGRADEEWVATILSEAELGLWRRMSGADRRHAVGVARRAREALGPERATRPVLAAALLHDVGKVASGLGTFGRVAATLLDMAGIRPAPPRLERYLAHDRLGGDLLQKAGSDPLTVAWAREHHRPPERWSVPATTGLALKGADDD